LGAAGDKVPKETEQLEKKVTFNRRRLVLLNSILTSLAMLMLSFFKIPKGVLKKLDYYRSRFFLAE